MTSRIHTSLGDLISAYYDEFLAAYQDEELASVLTAQAINDLLDTPPQPVEVAEAA